MQGYDENNTLLLPPRAPGERLPTELLDYYKEYCSQLKDDGTFMHTCSYSLQVCLHTVCVPVLIYLCAAELKESSDEAEARMGDAREEEKRSRPSDAHKPDSKVEESHTTTLKPAEIREYKLFSSRTHVTYCNSTVYFSNACAFSGFGDDHRGKQWETGPVRNDPRRQGDCPPHVC